MRQAQSVVRMVLAASMCPQIVSRMSEHGGSRCAAGDSGCLGSRRLAAAERQSAQEREQLRDVQERLLRTEQFADATLASEAQAKAQATDLEQALAVSLFSHNTR